MNTRTTQRRSNAVPAARPILALAAAATLLGSSFHVEAGGPTGFGLQRRGKIATTELNWMHYQVLLHNEDLQRLLQHLNEEKELGPVVPKGFRWVDSKQALDRMLTPASTQGRGWNALVGYWENGAFQGNRETSVYAFRVAKTRTTGKPYTAMILVGRDLNTGNFWVRSLFREFQDSDPLTLHEYAVRDGSVVRLSSKKGEPLIRNAMLLASANTKDAFKNRTMPAMQKAPDVLAGVEAFMSTDPNAALNTTATGGQFSGTESREPWWKKIVNSALEKLRKRFESELQKLWNMALAWFEKFWPSVVKVIFGWL